jgi:DNA-binding transcriptional ArsR family regulator
MLALPKGFAMPVHTDAPRTSGRGWGYTGAMLGGLVSIAANVAHSYLPPAGAGTAWRPPLGDVVGAVFWPVALFVAIEILARTTWPQGARWVVVRFLGLLPVAVVAAIVSYNHLSALLAHYGESWLTSHIGPLAVDGLMVMASAALMATAPGRETATAIADTATTVAIPADTNPDTEADNTTAKTRTPRRTPTRKTGRPDTAAKVAALAAKHPEMTTGELAQRLKVSDRTVRRHLSTRPDTDPGPPTLAAA